MKPAVVGLELEEFLLGSEDQAVERATRRPDSGLTRHSSPSRAGSAVASDGVIGGGPKATGCIPETASLCSASSETRAWPDDSEVNEHFALSLAIAVAPTVFYVNTRAFDAPGLLRGHRLAELELGHKAVSMMEDESPPTVHTETSHWNVRKSIIVHRARAAKVEARRRILEGGDTA